jgi:Cft2 family RNA processing exonuclease
LSNVRFTPLGGVEEVGASSFLVEIDDLRLIVDCGLHPKKEGRAALPDFSHLKRAPHAVLISHAHIDHCGSMPLLVKTHPSVVPYCTRATLRIMDRMLHNSVSVMGILRDEKGIREYPLYEHTDVDIALRKAYGIDFDRDFVIHPDSPVRVRFTRAGHVLGAASIRIKAPKHTIFYTGDICTIDQELMAGFVPPADSDTIDTLIMESTYGANEAADEYSYTGEIDRLGKEIAAVLNRGGSVLVPSFALGRAQEVLNIVARLQEAGRIPEVPVFASGLGRAVYEIYNAFTEELRPGADLAPMSQFARVGDVWDPKVVPVLLREPCIIVATSGMMLENTPSAVIAHHMLQETKHGIFFVGYCDPDTPGHRVKHASKGDRLVLCPILGEVKVRLENIESFHFSAHAPRRALQAVAERINPKNVIFVHGDPPALQWMREHCANGASQFAPAVGETVQLKA